MIKIKLHKIVRPIENIVGILEVYLENSSNESINFTGLKLKRTENGLEFVYPMMDIKNKKKYYYNLGPVLENEVMTLVEDVIKQPELLSTKIQVENFNFNFDFITTDPFFFIPKEKSRTFGFSSVLLQDNKNGLSIKISGVRLVNQKNGEKTAVYKENEQNKFHKSFAYPSITIRSKISDCIWKKFVT